VGHRADQRAGTDGGLQVFLRQLLAGVPAGSGEVDVEPRRDRALGLVEDGLEFLRQDQLRKQLLAVDVVRILLLD